MVDWLEFIRDSVTDEHFLEKHDCEDVPQENWLSHADKVRTQLTFDDLPSAPKRIPPSYLREIIVVPSFIVDIMSSVFIPWPPSAADSVDGKSKSFTGP